MKDAPLSRSARALMLFQFGALLLAAFVINLGGAYLFDLDEGAFTAATMEMLQRGDYITTYLNGEPRFDKPILIYWLQALSVSAFWQSEFFYRLPSALAAIGWAVALFTFVRARDGMAAASSALIFMAGAAGVVVIGRSATADALLNLLITLACLDGYRAAYEGNKQARWRAYLWIGLGLLAKGPVAAAVPFMALTLSSLILRSPAAWLRVAWYPLGWVIAALVALPWYIAEYLDQGQDFIQGFFFTHNLGRFSDTMESHGGSRFYYIPGLLLVLLPFSAWMVRSLGSVRQVRSDTLTAWCWAWFGFVFVFFSLSGTQLPHYILYGSTPLFILMARYHRSLALRWALLPALILPGFMLLFPWAAGTVANSLDDLYLQAMLLDGLNELGALFWWSAWVLFLLTLAAILVPAGRIAKFYTIAMLHSLTIALLVLPVLADFQQRPVYQAARIARALSLEVVMWRVDMPSFTLYRGEVTPKREPMPGDVVFTRIGRIDEADVLERFYRSGGIELVRLRD